MNENPYAAPSSESVAVLMPGSDAESIRNQYIAHEASVKSIGTLYFLGALLLVPIGLVMLGGAGYSAIERNQTTSPFFLLGLGMFYLLLGIGQAATAIGLRRLQPWARTVAAILSAIGLLGIPIGTLISAYFLYLLLSKKGSMVFSDDYKRVIAETPHIKYRTSLLVLILLGILLILLVVGIVAAVFGA